MFPTAFVYAPAFDAADGFTFAALLQPLLQQAVIAPRDHLGHRLAQQIVTRPAIGAHHLVIEIDDAALKINDDNRLQSVSEYLGQTAQALLRLLHRVDVHEGQNQAVDDVFGRTVRHDAQKKPLSLLGLDFGLPEDQSAQNFAAIANHFIIRRLIQIRHQVREWTPDIGRDQVDQAFRLLGVAGDFQLSVQKDGGDFDAVEQVLHVVIGARQLIDFGLQLGVDRAQFFVQRLHLLLGGLKFFVGSLQLFNGGLQRFLGGLQLPLERRSPAGFALALAPTDPN